MAVLKDNWFRGGWLKTISENDLPERAEAAVRIVQKMVWKHGATAIAIKINPPDRSSPHFEQIIDGIKMIAICNNIPCTTYRIEDLHQKCLVSESQKQNKVSLAVSLLHRFPRLLDLYGKACSKHGISYLKVFEAVACAFAYSAPDDWTYEKIEE